MVTLITAPLHPFFPVSTPTYVRFVFCFANPASACNRFGIYWVPPLANMYPEKCRQTVEKKNDLKLATLARHIDLIRVEWVAGSSKKIYSHAFAPLHATI